MVLCKKLTTSFKLNLAVVVGLIFVVSRFPVNYSRAQTAPDDNSAMILNVVMAADQKLSGISASYTYDYKPGPGLDNWLRAAQLLTRIRAGIVDPTVDELIFQNAYKAQLKPYRCELNTDFRRYSVRITRFSNDPSRVSTYLFDGKQYFVNNNDNARWDIVPSDYFTEVSYANLVKKLPFAAGLSADSVVEFTPIDYGSMFNGDLGGLKLEKLASDEYRIRCISNRSVKVDDKEYCDVYELDVSMKDGYRVLRSACFRADASEATTISSSNLQPDEFTQIIFRNHKEIFPSMYLPTEISIPVYARFTGFHGHITTAERAVINKKLPDFDLDKPTLICDHLIKVEKMTTDNIGTESSYKPSFNKDSVVYNQLTRRFEEPVDR